MDLISSIFLALNVYCWDRTRHDPNNKTGSFNLAVAALLLGGMIARAGS